MSPRMVIACSRVRLSVEVSVLMDGALIVCVCVSVCLLPALRTIPQPNLPEGKAPKAAHGGTLLGSLGLAR